MQTEARMRWPHTHQSDYIMKETAPNAGGEAEQPERSDVAGGSVK